MLFRVMLALWLKVRLNSQVDLANLLLVCLILFCLLRRVHTRKLPISSFPRFHRGSVGDEVRPYVP